MIILMILAGIVMLVGLIASVCQCRRMARIRGAGTWRRII